MSTLKINGCAGYTFHPHAFLAKNGPCSQTVILMEPDELRLSVNGGARLRTYDRQLWMAILNPTQNAADRIDRRRLQ